MKLHHFAALALIALTTTASADGLYGVGEVTYSSASLDNSYFDNALATSGATGLSFAIAACTTNDTASYTVVVTNLAGSASVHSNHIAEAIQYRRGDSH